MRSSSAWKSVNGTPGFNRVNRSRMTAMTLSGVTAVRTATLVYGSENCANGM
jgi:hypothetical protein